HSPFGHFPSFPTRRSSDLPLDAPQLRSPWGQNGALNRALAARRLAHSQRSISLYVSRPSAHVGWTGLFCSLGELFVVLQGRISGDRKSTRLNSSHVSIAYA